MLFLVQQSLLKVETKKINQPLKFFNQLKYFGHNYNKNWQSCFVIFLKQEMC